LARGVWRLAMALVAVATSAGIADGLELGDVGRAVAAEVAASRATRSPKLGPHSKHALEGAASGGSHAACCNRSRQDEIPDLHPRAGRSGRAGTEARNGELGTLLAAASTEPRDPGDLRGGVSGGRPGAQPRARGACGTGDAGAEPGRRSARDQN